jgi:FtsP/CotA-like multicopper oxidase with cupredoxin domain
MLFSAFVAIVGLGVQPQLIASRPRLPLPRPAANAPKATINLNHTPSGVRSGNVLTLAIDIVESAWRPEGDADPEVPIFAFAERGRSPSVPGPLIRVPRGTDVRLVIRNRVDSTLVIGGLRPGAAANDTVQLAPGATRELQFRLNAPGTFFYWGVLGGTTLADRLWLDSQLNGAIVVDPPGGSPPDHVFVISEWFHPYDDRPYEVVSTINGKAWPYTERLSLQQGDSMRLRVINTLDLHHPMHLHGAYYRVLARGKLGERRTHRARVTAVAEHGPAATA